MIYLNNNRQTQSVYIPRRSGGYGSNNFPVVMRIVLRSTVDNTTYSVNVRGTIPSGAYWLISLKLPDGIQSGEYDFVLYQVTLTPNPDPVAKGVCMIWPEEEGPAGPAFMEYGDEPTFKQYNNE